MQISFNKNIAAYTLFFALCFSIPATAGSAPKHIKINAFQEQSHGITITKGTQKQTVAAKKQNEPVRSKTIKTQIIAAQTSNEELIQDLNAIRNNFDKNILDALINDTYDE